MLSDAGHCVEINDYTLADHAEYIKYASKIAAEIFKRLLQTGYFSIASFTLL
jgi:hypothetical protein